LRKLIYKSCLWHHIAERLLRLVLNTNKSINQVELSLFINHKICFTYYFPMFIYIHFFPWWGLGGWVVMVVDFWPQTKHYWHEYYILRWNSSVMASINLPKAWGFNDQFVITVQAFLHHTSGSYDFAENLISDNKT
jgi:hypothetical protein